MLMIGLPTDTRSEKCIVKRKVARVRPDAVEEVVDDLRRRNLPRFVEVRALGAGAAGAAEVVHRADKAGAARLPVAMEADQSYVCLLAFVTGCVHPAVFEHSAYEHPPGPRLFSAHRLPPV